MPWLCMPLGMLGSRFNLKECYGFQLKWRGLEGGVGCVCYVSLSFIYPLHGGYDVLFSTMPACQLRESKPTRVGFI